MIQVGKQIIVYLHTYIYKRRITHSGIAHPLAFILLQVNQLRLFDIDGGFHVTVNQFHFLQTLTTLILSDVFRVSEKRLTADT